MKAEEIGYLTKSLTLSRSPKDVKLSVQWAKVRSESRKMWQAVTDKEKERCLSTATEIVSKLLLVIDKNFDKVALYSRTSPREKAGMRRVLNTLVPIRNTLQATYIGFSAPDLLPAITVTATLTGEQVIKMVSPELAALPSPSDFRKPEAQKIAQVNLLQSKKSEGVFFPKYVYLYEFPPEGLSRGIMLAPQVEGVYDFSELPLDQYFSPKRRYNLKTGRLILGSGDSEIHFSELGDKIDVSGFPFSLGVFVKQGQQSVTPLGPPAPDMSTELSPALS